MPVAPHIMSKDKTKPKRPMAVWVGVVVEAGEFCSDILRSLSKKLWVP
jgi:hypothetical protein